MSYGHQGRDWHHYLLTILFLAQVHTYIIIWAVLETLLTHITLPKKRQGLLVIALFAAAYISWSYIIYLNIGKWVYPILNVLTDVQVRSFQQVLFFRRKNLTD